jgi:hypothetical protein
MAHSKSSAHSPQSSKIIEAGDIGEKPAPGSASSAWRWTKHTNTFIRKERSHADSDEIWRGEGEMKVTRFEDAKALRAPAEGGMTDYDFLEFEIRHKILNELQAPESGEADAALRALASYHEVCAIVVDEVGHWFVGSASGMGRVCRDQ